MLYHFSHLNSLSQTRSLYVQFVTRKNLRKRT